ncbi:dihydrodipicolinate reductase C-terminal domain-containing protein [Amycolatopsis sp. CA-230715]|uniref:dihydrodipicolinate reductase C-terminal domain-containing protein n=1 Tax=Amycolatopsis sp. CA-230715 TaxID=2745196 RepID=UPI001C018EF6|nr:dihydrodipicolinate reductase C-terminal domain-containing protein [Amycolatopsis sp. CA-230715]QWF76792.1 4-hydroxy-tetrahydrodipicolinate reductase [Amycolatopsis sp. CA-230715]
MPEFVLGVVGATGRFGTAVRAECERQGVHIGLTASRAGWRESARVSVLADTSVPDALPDTVEHCRNAGAALVYCVSTVSDDARRSLAELGRDQVVVLADNLSVGHWMQTRLVRTIATMVASAGKRPRMSVHERHPVTKKDSPSASAKSLAAAWASAAPPELCGGTTAQRSGQPVSDHAVTFDLPGMSLSITHSVSDLRAAATGLVDVARYARGLAPGLYPVFDVYSRMYGDGT